MSTYLTIGRCQMDEPPTTADWSGSVLTLTGDIVEDSAEARLAVRQQLIGLIDNSDEPVVPLVFTEDARINGYYRPLGVSVGSSPTMLDQGIVPYSVTLQRIGSGESALIETAIASSVRTNEHSVTTAEELLYAWPNTASAAQETISGTTRYTRTSAEGAVRYAVLSTSSAQAGSVSYRLDPSYWYTGAARIEVKGSDSVWRSVIGRDVPRGAAGLWRLSNGLVRVYPTSTVGDLYFECYDTNAWVNVCTFEGAGLSGAERALAADAGLNSWATPSILRNDADVCVLRFQVLRATGETHIETYSIRRGCRHVEIDFKPPSSATLGLRFTTTTASTALATSTAGLYSTSNDANGNRAILMSNCSVTKDLTEGRIYSTETSATLAVGAEVDGSGAAAPNRHGEILQQFLGPTFPVTRVFRS